jgi:hypothetical protein
MEVAMRFLNTSIAIASFVLIGGLQIATGQPVASATPIQLAAGAGPTSDRDTYTRAMQDDMLLWQQKLHDYGEIARARAHQTDAAAESALDTAWAKTQVEAHKLPAATAEGWASAKASYEQASHALADAWDKVRH